MFSCRVIKNLLHLGSFLKDSNASHSTRPEYRYAAIRNDSLGDKSLNPGLAHDQDMLRKTD